MAHILIDPAGRCFCSCADKCVVEHKSGMQSRCSKEQIIESGHKIVEVKDNKTTEAIKRISTLDGEDKTLILKRVKKYW